MDFEFHEDESGAPVLTLVHASGLRLAGDMAELEPAVWAALADMLPASSRVTARGRSTGAPGVLLGDCLANRDKRATFAEPSCARLAAIQREWGLDVQAGQPSEPRFLDACCLDVDGMEAPKAREALRQVEAAMRQDGWLVVRGADADLLAACMPPEWRAVRLDRPYGNRVSVCHRDGAALEAFGARLAELLRPVV